MQASSLNILLGCVSISAILFTTSCKKEKLGDGVDLQVFKESGLDSQWHPTDQDIIAYSAKGIDGFYDVYLTNFDQTQDVCITCDHPTLPNKHIGSISWHPSGEWLVCIAEKAEHPGSSTDALPGFGAYSDIWLISKDGNKAHKLVHTINDYNHGAIFVHFSQDGKKLIWTSRTKGPNILNPKRQFGYWEIKTANFRFGIDSLPILYNEKTLKPGGDAFYESYGFTQDGSQILFCSNYNQPSAWDQQIFLMDTNGNNVRQLTDEGYNEHARFNHSEDKIVWMTGIDNDNTGTDWWIMETDGSNKERLTYMNKCEHEHYMGKARWAGFGSFSPDGKWYISGAQKSLITQEGMIMLLDMESTY